MPPADQPNPRRLSPRARQDQLARDYQNHPARRDAAVRGLLPIAESLARKYKRGEEPFDDLKQVASMGLLKALARYDRAHGHFVAFAAPTITGELRRHFRDTGWAVHVPRGLQERAQQVIAFERRFATGHDRRPTVRETAAELGVTLEEASEAVAARHGMRPGSLDVTVGDDEAGPTLGERLGTVDAGYERAEQRAAVGTLARELGERDRQILALRFGGDLTQREVGERVGVTQMHVSRLLSRSIETMRRRAGG